MNNKTSIVSLVNASHHTTISESILKSLEFIKFDFDRKINKIAIKPNLCYYWKSSTGETTDPKVIDSIIKIFKTHTNVDEIYIVESDATAMRTRYACKMLDYESMFNEKIKFINLCNDKLMPVKSIENIEVDKRIRMPKTLSEVDLFISVPKLKMHSLTGLSCALKNQFGCIPYRNKIRFHKKINAIIPIVNKLFKPDLIIVDGIITRGKTPKKLNLIMSGYDPVAIDYVAAKIVGQNPKKIKHIISSQELGVGSTKVNIVGDDLTGFIDDFPTQNFTSKIARKALLRLYSIYLRYLTLEGRIFDIQPNL